MKVGDAGEMGVGGVDQKVVFHRNGGNEQIREWEGMARMAEISGHLRG